MFRFRVWMLLLIFALFPGLARPDNRGNGTKATAMPTPDQQTGIEINRSLNETLARPLAELRGLATKIGTEVAGELRYGRVIARLAARQQLLEQARIECVTMATQAAKQRKELRAELDKELEQAKERFRDSPEQCEREQVTLIQTYRPALVSGKEQEEQCAQIVRDTDAKLKEVRLKRQMLETQRRLFQAGKLGALYKLPPVAIDVGENPAPAPGQAADNAASKKESLQQALNSLKGL
jgi:hypothetical protein